MELLGDWKRSSYCGDVRATQVGQKLTVMGWVHARRDHGGVTFIDLRDRSGLLQIVFNPQINPTAHGAAKDVRMEFVLAVRGVLTNRSPETINPNLPTGEVELQVSEMRVLNPSRTVPFPIDEETNPTENARLRYRYLDLRRPQMYANLLLRHRLAKNVRDYLDSEGFLEVETPFLTKSTPEGARDYLVPSRVNPGSFYALPQSPQLFKQLLMVGGFDKYFQIVRCFRDEDLRADRQPEFTQIDLEMSFPQPDRVFEVVEGFLQAAFKAAGVDVKTPFPRMTYDEAIPQYGTDKPDLRLPKLMDVRPAFTDEDLSA